MMTISSIERNLGSIVRRIFDEVEDAVSIKKWTSLGNAQKPHEQWADAQKIITEGISTVLETLSALDDGCKELNVYVVHYRLSPLISHANELTKRMRESKIHKEVEISLDAIQKKTQNFKRLMEEIIQRLASFIDIAIKKVSMCSIDFVEQSIQKLDSKLIKDPNPASTNQLEITSEAALKDLVTSFDLFKENLSGHKQNTIIDKLTVEIGLFQDDDQKMVKDGMDH